MNTLVTIPNETVLNKILFIRSKKVLVDRDLAELYGVETKVLNQAVKRNSERFPEDFMFKLSAQETILYYEQRSRSQFVTLDNKTSTEPQFLRSQIVTSKTENRGGQRYSPVVFTEQGVAMLSSVLKSPKAIQVNIQIIRTFTKLREILTENKKLAEKVEQMERTYDKHIYHIFNAINKLKADKEKLPEETQKEKIGFRVGNK